MAQLRVKSACAAVFVVMALVGVGCAPSLGVAPRLVARWPLADARLSVARHTFELTFNRPLEAHSTWATVNAQDGSAMPTDVSVDAADARRLRVHLLEPKPGQFELRWRAAASGSGLASEGTQAFTLETAAPAPPRIDIDPAIAEAGDRLELLGKGFEHNAPVQLTIGDDDQPLVSAQTDAQGKFNLEARVPLSMPYGVQRISVFEGDQRAATGSVQVHWGGWPPLVATNVGQPGPDRGEVTFTLNLRNRSDYVLEHVRVTVDDPDGGQLVSADAGAHRENGSVVWDIPVMDRGGYGPLHATYRAEHALVSHASLEYRHRSERGCGEGDCLPPFISTSTAESTPVSAD